MTNRESLLYTIEIRFESIFGDDMVFENFMNIEQTISDSDLELLADSDDWTIEQTAIRLGWTKV